MRADAPKVLIGNIQVGVANWQLSAASAGRLPTDGTDGAERKPTPAFTYYFEHEYTCRVTQTKLPLPVPPVSQLRPARLMFHTAVHANQFYRQSLIS